MKDLDKMSKADKLYDAYEQFVKEFGGDTIEAGLDAMLAITSIHDKIIDNTGQEINMKQFKDALFNARNSISLIHSVMENCKPTNQ